MKVEVSVPNPIFEAANRLAEQLDMSLSEFYTAALSAYLTAYQHESVTEQLDRVYETEPSALDPDLVQLQVASLDNESW